MLTQYHMKAVARPVPTLPEKEIPVAGRSPAGFGVGKVLTDGGGMEVDHGERTCPVGDLPPHLPCLRHGTSSILQGPSIKTAEKRHALRRGLWDRTTLAALGFGLRRVMSKLV